MPRERPGSHPSQEEDPVSPSTTLEDQVHSYGLIFYSVLFNISMDMLSTCSILCNLPTWWCLANVNMLLPGI